MDKYELIETDAGQQLRVPKRGTSVLRFPLYNKGTAFSIEERKRFGLEGLLPAHINTIEEQAERSFRSIMFNQDPVGRHIGLAALQDRNEHLYYKVLSMHLEELMPIVYTPTVGKTAQYFSRVYRRERGLWITPHHKGRIEHILRTAAPFEDVDLMVVTDNEAILGIGDQGCGGMAISVGKLALYCAGAGIHPARTLPVSLDVGTDNEELLADPLYLGYPKKRIRGKEYHELVDEFVVAARKVFPNVVIQWEDFRKSNALEIARQHREFLPSFNDDIQGTGAVAYAALLAANRITGDDIKNTRVVVYGAGAAGYGIARKIFGGLRHYGLEGDELHRSIISMDSRGVLHDGRKLTEYKQNLSWPQEAIADLGLSDEDCKDLTRVVAAFKPNVLIGTSGQPKTFTEECIRTMAAATETPVIMPMSNPTDKTEAVPEDVMRWTDGRALIATGSPFDPVEVNGKKQRIGQANNVFIFPGLGLGTIVSRASVVTDAMIGTAALALARSLSDDDLNDRCLMPVASRLWEVCGNVALAVAERAMVDGVAEKLDHAEIKRRIEDYRWKAAYPEMIEG